MLSLFYGNACHLSPDVREPKHLSKQLVDTTDCEAVPECFETVACAFQDFRERLSEFRDYTVCITPFKYLTDLLISTKNESIKIKAFLLLFEKDLKVCI
jgi:hypothetical protein